jgi:hypothetical protein
MHSARALTLYINSAWRCDGTLDPEGVVNGVLGIVTSEEGIPPSVEMCSCEGKTIDASPELPNTIDSVRVSVTKFLLASSMLVTSWTA